MPVRPAIILAGFITIKTNYIQMKKLFTVVLLTIAIAAQAQQNRLLESSFWQGSPDVEAVKAEIAKGNSPSQMNPSGYDPVVLAINAGAPSASILHLLAQPGNEADKITHDSRIYLHWASSRGNIEIAEYLLKKNAKITVQDSHGNTPLLFAANAAQQNTKVYDLLIAHGADIRKELNPEGANALLLAISNDKEFALTNYFISKGLDLNSIDAGGNNAFSYAARSGNIPLLKSLIQKGIKPNATAILMTARAGRAAANSVEFYQYLESLNLKPNVTGESGENALHAIVRRPNQNEIIKYFLSKGTDVNKADELGNTPFMYAAMANRDTAVLDLLAAGLKNFNTANVLGQTALALAVKSNSPQVVSYLIRKGADLNVSDKKGNNLAYYLIESLIPAAGGQRPAGANVNGLMAEDFETKLKILQDKGLNIAAPQKDGNTLYHLAAAKNDLTLLKRLQGFAIDINAKNSEGLTALHKAALVSRDDANLKYLLSAGAKKDLLTNFDESAFDLAAENEILKKNNVSVSFLK